MYYTLINAYMYFYLILYTLFLLFFIYLYNLYAYFNPAYMHINSSGGAPYRNFWVPVMRRQSKQTRVNFVIISN